MGRDGKIAELKSDIERLQFVIDALSLIPPDSCSQVVYDTAVDADEASWNRASRTPIVGRGDQMNWIKMADQKPPVGVDMLALRKISLGVPRFSSGLFVERSSGDESYLVFALPRASGVWDTDDITHWALVELPK